MDSPEPQQEDFEIVDKIAKKDLKPIHNVNCKHENIVPDYDDQTEHYLAFRCADCIVGYLSPKPLDKKHLKLTKIYKNVA
jgi:hypothetical protein